MGRLENKVAVITGATSGIGEAVALMYAKEGAKLVTVGRNKDKGKELTDKIAAMGGESIFVGCDLRKKEFWYISRSWSTTMMTSISSWRPTTAHMYGPCRHLSLRC